MFIDFIKNIKINDGFWSNRLEHVMNETLPYQWKALNDLVPGTVKSSAIANFKMIAGEIEKGEFNGFVFQDSDLYKWLEAVAYSLMIRPDAQLESTADEVIELIAKTQWEDGYINSSYTLKEPDKRWTNIRDCHELYCAGHMFEAAAAYFVATGKRRFIDISEKFADHIMSVIGPEEGKLHAYPGHEEIELALVKLYRVTGKQKYLELAKYFIDERGAEPYFFTEEAIKRSEPVKDADKNSYGKLYNYHQAHLPVREQNVATGHAVRAMYLYCAMTDVAVQSNDDSLKQAVKRLWKNVTRKQMYITGAIGSQSNGESFSFDYDLPNDEAYAETCAQIGLFLWAYRMFEMEHKSEYADIMEKVLYNGIISGVSLDGKKYFYTNPLEIIPSVAENRKDKHQDIERRGWFACACCPPNLARLMLSLGSFVYSVFDKEIYVNLFIGSEAKLEAGGVAVDIKQKSRYERDGKVCITVKPHEPAEFSLKLRIPYWAGKLPDVFMDGSDISGLDINFNDNGYVTINGKWTQETSITMSVDVKVKVISSNVKVTENAGKVALSRGAFIYCFEEVDNGSNLSALSLITESDEDFIESYERDLLNGITTVSCSGYRRISGEALYEDYSACFEKVKLTAIPYYAWNNRGVGEMKVWIGTSRP